jgi:hypothetical protein
MRTRPWENRCSSQVSCFLFAFNMSPAATVVDRKHALRPLDDKAVVQKSCATLTRYLTEIRDRIIHSAHHMPPLMRAVFKILRERNAERWPGPEYAVRPRVLAVVSALNYGRF